MPTFQSATSNVTVAIEENCIETEKSVCSTGGIIRIVIGLVVIVLNMSVVISVLRIPKTSKFHVTYILLGNLALTDAGTGLWLIIMTVYGESGRFTNEGFWECLIFFSKYSKQSK